MSALQRLAKWRTVFAGWQLGTRDKADPEAAAVRDHRELTMIMRAELSALTGLMIEKGVFTAQEFSDALEAEADLLSKDYEKRFPGVRATDTGIEMNVAVMREHGTMEGWKP